MIEEHVFTLPSWGGKVRMQRARKGEWWDLNIEVLEIQGELLEAPICVFTHDTVHPEFHLRISMRWVHALICEDEEFWRRTVHT